ncbi:tetratricopeptide repeat protein [[Phormidium] sp. LEGE 05292]|uniref:tetratricopeptide repeat protein n=1 Tax=[Phormidium] sp. LEGE 05292 TaxID=767427 RepID=UPI002AD273FF|nr:tetratricopeptide repeat protein [Phormidium sp. LEGE 05292]
MSEKLRRWLVFGFLLVGTLGFVIPTIMPFLGGRPSQEASSARTPASVQTPAGKQEELQAQAKGYQLVLQREPDNETALKGLLFTQLELVRQGVADVNTTIEPLEKLAKLKPENTEYAVLLAQAKQQTGDREGAAKAYRAILESQPGDIKALQGLVSLLLAEGRPEAAIGLLQDTLESAPNLNQIKPNTVNVISVQLMLGQVYAEQGRYADAINVYDNAIKANKEDFRPVLAKALVLQKQGKTDDAKSLFNSAANLAPAQYKDQIVKLASSPPAAAPAAPTAPTTKEKTESKN